MTAATRAALAALMLVVSVGVSAAGAQATRREVPALPAMQARRPARPAPTRPAEPKTTPAVATRAPRGPVQPAATPPPLPARRADLADNGESWAQITAETVNLVPDSFPIGRGHEGPSVLHVQVLLERAFFSPGMLDGKWGRNTEVAVYWLQAREGLDPTGVVDAATFARLAELAGRPAEVVIAHELSAEDVRGPFTRIPGNIYEHARLACSCYESLGEKLTEQFHARAELLRKLNPGVDLDRVTAGTRLRVPANRPLDAPAAGQVAELWVSGQQNFLQAVDAQGRILYHFPTTLGSTYDPSPQGDFSVRSVHPDPWWHYQPKLLAHVPDDRPDARIPPGPNSSVGRVWMALSAPHYGIHGTKSPETIGYATSAGCVRLTNWDVMFLSRRVPSGTRVRFRDTRPATPQAAPEAAPAPAGPDLLGVRADSARPPAPPADTTARPAADSTPRAPADTLPPSAPASPAPAAPDSAAPPPA